MEKSSFSFAVDDVVSPPSGSAKDLKPWQIVSRFHFTSKLKRMTTLSVQTSSFSGETTVLAAVKGAPETLKPMASCNHSLINVNFERIFHRGFQ